MCQMRAVKEVGDEPAKLGFPGSRLHGIGRLQVFTVPKSHSNGRQGLEWPSQGQAMAADPDWGRRQVTGALGPQLDCSPEGL